MGVFAVAAIFSELGNGANFALVPHCNAYNNVGPLPPSFRSDLELISFHGFRFALYRA